MYSTKVLYGRRLQELFNGEPKAMVFEPLNRLRRAESSIVPSSRGDRTPVELFVASAAGLEPDIQRVLMVT